MREQEPASGPVQVGLAGEADIEGILALQAENRPERGGALSASFSRERIAATMREMPLIVAREGDSTAAFLMTSTRAAGAGVPILRAMLAAYPGAPDAYIYGPVCVGSGYRRQGVAQAMFRELRRLVPGREGILFIRRDNPASLRAHAKMGMREVAGFRFDTVEYAVLCFVG